MNAINSNIESHTNHNYILPHYNLINHPSSLRSAIIKALFQDTSRTQEELSQIHPYEIFGSTTHLYFLQLPLPKQIALYKLWDTIGYKLSPPSNLQLLYRFSQSQNDADAMNLLIKFGANETTTKEEYEQYDQELIDICNDIDKKWRWSQWQNTSESERTELAETLLDKGANPNFVGPHHDRTPLILAMCIGHYNLAARLLYAGANPNVSESKAGFTPLSLIGVEQKKTDKDQGTTEKTNNILQTLLLAGASPNYSNTEGITALMWLSNYSTIETVQQLIKIGANPHAITTSGHTAVDFAVSGKKREIADYLRL